MAGMFEGLRNAERELAKPKKEKVIVESDSDDGGELPDIAGIDFSSLGGSMNWADAGDDELPAYILRELSGGSQAPCEQQCTRGAMPRVPRATPWAADGCR